MREIKFRAWNIKDKEYEFFDDSISEGERVITLPNCKIKELVMDTRFYEGSVVCEDVTENYILEQYIGKKDENDKEIYEGDILEIGRKSSEMEAIIVYIVDDVLNLPNELYGTEVYYIKIIGNVNKDPDMVEMYNELY